MLQNRFLDREDTGDISRFPDRVEACVTGRIQDRGPLVLQVRSQERDDTGVTGQVSR